MADHAANQAMNRGTNAHALMPNTNAQLSGADEYLETDLAPWWPKSTSRASS